jgi:DDE superfamily endonuclease
VLPIAGIPLSLGEFAEQFSDVFNHPAQMDHFKEILTGLIVSENRTVAGIHQRLIDGDNYDALRKFLSRSPWSAETLQTERLKWIGNNQPQIPETPTVVAIDSSFIHHTGENIYGVYWYMDYAKRCYVTAQRLVLSTWVTPTKQVPISARLFHRGFLEEQQLYLESVKPATDAPDEEWESYKDLVEVYEENAKNHVKQWQLAGDLVEQVEGLGLYKDAYVLDAGLLAPDLAAKIEKYGQAWVSRLAKSRLVDLRGNRTQSLLSFAKELPPDVFKPVAVKTRHGEPRTYWCFSKCLKIHGWQKLRVVISYNNEELEGEPIFLVTNKLNWTQPAKIVQLYCYRDPIEHFIRDQKQELGLEDCQQRTQQAVEKYWELSFTAHTYLELAFNAVVPAEMPTKKLETIGQKCRLMELEILQGLIERVTEWVLGGWDTKELIERIMLKRLNRLAS